MGFLEPIKEFQLFCVKWSGVGCEGPPTLAGTLTFIMIVQHTQDAFQPKLHKLNNDTLDMYTYFTVVLDDTLSLRTLM